MDDPALWCTLPSDVIHKEILHRLLKSPQGLHLARCVSKAWSDESWSHRQMAFCIRIGNKDKSNKIIRRWLWFSPEQSLLRGYNRPDWIREVTYQFDESKPIVHFEGNVLAVSASVSTSRTRDMHGTRVNLKHRTILQGIFRIMLHSTRVNLKRLIDMEAVEPVVDFVKQRWSTSRHYTTPQHYDIHAERIKHVAYEPRYPIAAKSVFDLYCVIMPGLTWDQFQMMNGHAEYKKWEEVPYDNRFDEIEEEMVDTETWNWYWFERKITHTPCPVNATMSLWLSDEPLAFQRTLRIVEKYNQATNNLGKSSSPAPL
jgi:hypothetical protein